MCDEYCLPISQFFNYLKLLDQTSPGTTMVEHSTRNNKIEGSYPTNGTGREKWYRFNLVTGALFTTHYFLHNLQ